MLVFVIRRVLISIPVLIASTIVTFIIVKLSGDPLTFLKQRQPQPSKAFIAAEEHQFWLDRSWPSQYWHWISNIVFHWNWGGELRSATPVRTDVFSALGVTVRLVVASVVIALVLAVITGVVSAVRQYSVLDYSTTFLGFIFLSMPTFWFAILLKQGGIWVNEKAHHQIFFTIGERSIPVTDHSLWGTITDIAGHMILPVIVLGLVGYAAWSRFTRASMLEVLNSDYVRLARSKGLSPRTVLVKHALRTALIPLTTVTALDIAALLGGAIVTETVFQWNGMGRLFVFAVTNTDFNIMLGWLLIAAVMVILFNLIADVLYGVLDPRIRHA
ncbi:MAG TPA: ABC transporter permease [Jatrophihabitantaceae bacterium]|jgi:peptide/nickel transport system permease protein